MIKTFTSLSLELKKEKNYTYYYRNQGYFLKYFYVFIDSAKTYEDLKEYFLSRFNMDIENDIKKTFF